MKIIFQSFFFLLFLVLLVQEANGGGDELNGGHATNLGKCSGELGDNYLSAETVGPYECTAYSAKNCDGQSVVIPSTGVNFDFNIQSVKCECK
ncbi:CLUMA_CG012279, isoform A [Clunio marinus]|uniref:CLUMA_CG012279, isoform A n=1 Tax=Clunio marinus TaxID=568069 RepID=A0A1J1IK95_9DIPT|nr:CLUMA_CG012279, isoform A [Clunio marinus]